MSGARDRYDVIALCEHPRQRQLRRSGLVLFRDLLDLRYQLEILLEVLALKARVLSPEVVLGQVVDLLDLSGEESAAERTVGYESDIQESEGIEQTFLGIAGPQ